MSYRTADDILDSIDIRTQYIIAQITDHTGKISTDRKIELLGEYVGRIEQLLEQRPPRPMWWQRLLSVPRGRVGP